MFALAQSVCRGKNKTLGEELLSELGNWDPHRSRLSPEAVEDQADEEDDEEVMGVPEDLKVGSADYLHGRGNDEDEGQCDGHARQSSDGSEHGNCRVLQSQTRPPSLTRLGTIHSSIIIHLEQ